MVNCPRVSIKHALLPVYTIGCVCLLFLLAMGCGAPSSDSFTIGVICKMPETSPVYVGFKNGMKDMGYVEGDDLFFIYREVSDASQKLVGNTIADLLGQNIDLLLTVEYDIAMKCREFTKDTGTPILFISNPFPVEMGLVDSLDSPGANLTGVRLPETVNKALEWLTVLIPEARRIYLPYNPDDDITAMEIIDLEQTAAHLDIDLVFDEIHSIEETLAAIESLREDIDAIFRIPSRTLNSENSLITQAGLELGIPTFSSLLLDEDVLLTFTGDFKDAGRQAARLAQQILNGAAPSELPVETSGTFLTINLKTAEKIDLPVPQEILSQATYIIR